MLYTPYLWLFMLSAGVILALVFLTWRTKATPTRRGFLILMLCALIWVVGFTFETAVQSLEGKILFAKLQFLGLSFLPNAWLYLAFSYAGQTRSRAFWISFAVIPILTNLIIWFVPHPNWFWGILSLDSESAPFPVLNSDYQFWFYFVHALSGYVYIAVATVIVVRAMVRAQPIYRKQGALLLIAIFLPAVTDVLYVLGYSPIRYYNFTSATFSVSGLLLGWNLFRFQFLHLLPLARDAVFENLSDGIIVLDEENRIVDFNPAAKKMSELSSSTLGQPVEILQSQLLAAIEAMQSANESQRDVAVGENPTFYYDLKLTPINGPSNRRIGWAAALRDVTDRVNLLSQVTHIARHDGLTGILNRTQFMELASRELALHGQNRNYQLSYIALDLDNFKEINDTHGHAAGDQVLTAFTNECQRQLRSTDIFGRIGGDEFAILLVASVTTAKAVAERLRKRIMSLQIEVRGEKIPISTSLGLAHTGMLGGADAGLEELIHLGDLALYRAKQEGKNRVVME